MTEHEIRHEMCRVGKSLFDRGYVHATAGNVSVQLSQEQGGGFLITPTDACLGHLDPDRLARLNAQGEQVSGDRASKTIGLHRAIYQASALTDCMARCIIHTHSTHCVALTLEASEASELLPALTPYFLMKVGHVPLIPYHRPGAPEAAADVAKQIAAYAAKGQPIRAVMLSRLGPNVWHDSPAQAMAVLEELEETARLWWMVKGRASGLDAAAIAALGEAFQVTW